MVTYQTNCLYSTVKNTSGGSRVFSFLPPHGRTLANNEELTLFGDIRAAVGGNQGAEYSVRRRGMAGLEAAIASGDLQILETPAQLLVDTVTGATKMLAINNGTVNDVDPCWLDSVSE